MGSYVTQLWHGNPHAMRARDQRVMAALGAGFSVGIMATG